MNKRYTLAHYSTYLNVCVPGVQILSGKVFAECMKIFVYNKNRLQLTTLMRVSV